MKSNNFEQDKPHAFDSFCKKILKNEARDQYNAIKRHREREVPFSELSKAELGRLFTMGKYFEHEQTFSIFNLDVVVNDAQIASALSHLPKHRRDIILLSYFLGLSDREIGEKLDMIRATVQYQRTKALQELREIIKEDDMHEE